MTRFFVLALFACTFLGCGGSGENSVAEAPEMSEAEMQAEMDAYNEQAFASEATQ